MNVKIVNKFGMAIIAIILIGVTSTLYICDKQATLQKLVWILFAFVGICIIGSSANYKNEKQKYIRLISWVGFPYIITCVYTFGVVCIEGDGLGVLRQAISTTMFIVVDLCMVLALFFIFGGKLVYVLTSAIMLSYCITLYIGISNISFETYIKYLQGKTMYLDSWFEMHDVGVAVVPIALFFICKYMFINKEKKDIICLAIMLIVLVLCGKRSAEGAFVLGCLVILVMKISKRNFMRIAQTILLGLFLFSFLYVWIVQSGILQQICISHGINTMGRIEVYSWFNDQYSISPLYLGKGFQYIHRYMLAGLGSDVVNDFQYLHNSILQIFIELGFWGFVFWFGVLLYVIPRQIKKMFNDDLFYFYIPIILSTIFMYGVDNVLTYPLYIVSMYSVITVYAKLSGEKS